MKINVDLLKPIQVAFSFFDDDGNTPSGTSTYQFNFNFNLREDMYAQESIDLLSNAGIDFTLLIDDGIDPFDFAYLLTTSRALFSDSVVFIAFHGGSDFGYLTKMLTNAALPETDNEFFNLLKVYFPIVFDIKYLMKSCENLHGGLQNVARQLNIPRIGQSHQSGSDSLLSGQVFFRIKKMYFHNTIDIDRFNGHIFSLGNCAMYAPKRIFTEYTIQHHQQYLKEVVATGCTFNPTDNTSQKSSSITEEEEFEAHRRKVIEFYMKK
ncbi:hypothetical protein GJ496_008753 [Pomphorhynchus laevis]|nr:hypothetical protein GJ496_008753 [Pomphorhynchus laevis]